MGPPLRKGAQYASGSRCGTLAACALPIVTLRAGRTAGSTRRHKLHILSPAFGQGAVVTLCLLLHKKPLRWAFYGNLNPTPGRPGPACGRPWALPIRSGVCLPCAPVLRASCCHAAAAAQRHTAYPSAKNTLRLRRNCFFVCGTRCAAATPASALPVTLRALRDGRLLRASG